MGWGLINLLQKFLRAVIVTKFNGDDLRNIRKEQKLSRSEMAKLLGVSPVTIEKWEQMGNKPIRDKYEHAVSTIAGAGVAGAGIGLIAAPAVLPALGLFAGIGGLAYSTGLLSDRELRNASVAIENLKKLTPEERIQFVKLFQKMSEASDQAK